MYRLHRYASLSISAALAAVMIPHVEYRAGKGSGGKAHAADHGVAAEHKNPPVESKAENHADTKGDKKVDEPGKDTGAREQRGDEPKGEKKSIVPSKYAGKYKGGGSDPLALAITEHSQDPEKKEFSFDRFFGLMRANGVPEEHVAGFESQVKEGKLGAAGRARMTLRNRLDTIVRKNGHIVGHDGAKHDLKLGDKVIERAPKTEPAKEPVAA